MNRSVSLERNTKETEISLEINLDGRGDYDIDTGIGFFDHMLEGFARHGFFDLVLRVNGDINVDSHHTVEDTGIALGEAFRKALGDKEGITRFGSAILPMDDALVLVSLDFSNRPYLCFEAALPSPTLGSFETETVREFFLGFVNGAGINLHIRQMAGENTHHIIEAMFKAFAKSLDQAVRVDERIEGVLSTKGVL